MTFDPSDLLGEFPKFRRIIFLGAARFPELAQQIVETIITSSASESFAATLFFYILYPDRNEDFRRTEKLDVEALKQIFRERMYARYVASGLSIFDTSKEAALGSLFRWAECGDEGSAQVHTYLSEQFSKEPKYIGRFLSWNMMFGGFGRDEVDKINKLSSAQYIFSLLNFYGEKACGTDEDREAVEVFLSIFKDGSLDLSQRQKLTATAPTFSLFRADSDAIMVVVENPSSHDIVLGKIGFEYNGAQLVQPGHSERGWAIKAGATLLIQWAPVKDPVNAIAIASKNTRGVVDINIIAEAFIEGTLIKFRQGISVKLDANGLHQVFRSPSTD